MKTNTFEKPFSASFGAEELLAEARKRAGGVPVAFPRVPTQDEHGAAKALCAFVLNNYGLAHPTGLQVAAEMFNSAQPAYMSTKQMDSLLKTRACIEAHLGSAAKGDTL